MLIANPETGPFTGVPNRHRRSSRFSNFTVVQIVHHRQPAPCLTRASPWYGRRQPSTGVQVFHSRENDKPIWPHCDAITTPPSGGTSDWHTHSRAGVQRSRKNSRTRHHLQHGRGDSSEPSPPRPGRWVGSTVWEIFSHRATSGFLPSGTVVPRRQDREPLLPDNGQRTGPHILRDRSRALLTGPPNRRSRCLDSAHDPVGTVHLIQAHCDRFIRR